MRHMALPILFFVSLLVIGCAREKVSADQLIENIKAAGFSVTKEADIHHSIQGASDAFWLNIDGARVSAFQYSTVAKAKLKGKSLRNGVSYGFWAFEHVDDRTAIKLQKALEGE